jgi:hypothetical protein
MTVNIGRRNSIGIALTSTTGGTSEISTYLPFLSCGLIERHTPIADSQAKAVRDMEGGDSVEGKKWGEGGLEVILNTENAPLLFGLALGDIDSTESGALYDHTITMKEDNLPLTANIWRDRVVDQVDFTNCAVDRLEINFADDVVSLNTDILSKYPIEGRDLSPSHTSDVELYTFKNAYVELTNNSTTSALKIKEFSLEINNNLELVYAPGDNDVDRIISKGFRATGRISLLFEDETQKDAAKDLTKQALKVVFDGDTTGKIEIEIPQFRVDTYDQDSPLDDLVQEGVDFVAENDGTKTIEVVVTNETASY